MYHLYIVHKYIDLKKTRAYLFISAWIGKDFCETHLSYFK